MVQTGSSGTWASSAFSNNLIDDYNKTARAYSRGRQLVDDVLDLDPGKYFKGPDRVLKTASELINLWKKWPKFSDSSVSKKMDQLDMACFKKGQ